MSAPVTIVIPTFQRLDMLERAVLSAFDQDFTEHYGVLIVDNDPLASAQALAKKLERQAPNQVDFKYVHEPSPGVANARNTALEGTESKFIAFLDDDQSAPREWLRTLLQAQKDFPAAITFGPVHAALPDNVTKHKKYLIDFFSRTYDHQTGHTNESFGCGNSLMNMDLVPAERPIFDVAMNETGGEDDVLYSRVRRSGGKFGWCANAPVLEHVPEDRATLKYTLKRAISYGQGPITEARMRARPRWDLVVLWMVIGSVKASINFMIYAFHWAIRSDNRATYLDRTARGFGKVIWWKTYRFYGLQRLKSGKPATTD
ncbi:MAG: glycosyltransferase family 2 protein [Hyphomonas sp.]